MSEISTLHSGFALSDSRKAVRTLDTMLDAWDASVKVEREAKEAAKAMRAAADGADTGALEALVRQMERLARVAEENRRIKNHEHEGRDNGSITAALLFAADAQIQSRN